jgi:ribosomal protein S12 methylthiotransferase
MELPTLDGSSNVRASQAESLPSKGTYAFVSLGCPKNLVDSEKMLGTLALDGYTLVSEADGADFVIVNTCGFIEQSRAESKAVIREMLDLKRQGRVGAVVVAGCLAERKKEDLLREVPEVDHLVGVFGREEIAQVLDRTVAPHPFPLSPGGRGENNLVPRSPGGSGETHLVPHSPRGRGGRGEGEQRTLFRPAPVKALEDTARLRITPRHYAYLKISEGCDRLCTFCAIPSMRGKHVTKPIEEVLREARELAADGVRELILVAQDTTYYGLDLYGRVRLDELLRELEGVEGIEWIRLLYAYPIFFTDELIHTLARSKKILPYLDLPLQHINDRVLRRMQRRVNRATTEELLARLREAIPDLALRTTFIVGFPGETEAEFEELRDFVRAARFERVGVFPYSYEPGTPATRLDGHLPEEVKSQRRDRIMEVQQEVAFAWARAQVGKELEVLVDGPDPEVPGHFLARSPADAPDIDCYVRLKGKGLHAGDLVRARVTGADGYDLAARAIRVR